MTKVQIYTDGSARGNPDGPGGYGVVLHYTDREGRLHEKTLSAGYVRTTNNRMELMAAIAGLEVLNRPCQVSLYSDSRYLTDAFNKGWIDKIYTSNLSYIPENIQEKPWLEIVDCSLYAARIIDTLNKDESITDLSIYNSARYNFFSADDN